MSLSALKASIIKATCTSINLKTNVITPAVGQTITHNGVSFTVTHGGEYYTATSLKGEVREVTLSDLKISIRNDWYCELFAVEEEETTDLLAAKFTQRLPISTQRLNHLDDSGAVVLRYNTGPFGFWLMRRLCMFHNVAYTSIVSFRISDDNDTWALVVNPIMEAAPFIDEPLLS